MNEITCKYGHVHTNKLVCPECRKGYNKKYKEKHREEARAKEKIRHQENALEINAKRRSNYPLIREQAIQRALDWYRENRDSVLGVAAEKYANNPAKYLQRAKQWSSENPDKTLAIKLRRRDRISKNTGIVSKNIVEELLLRQSGLCACCNLSLSDGFHLDHIIPIAKGGRHEDENLQLLTPRCNMKKGAKLLLKQPT